MKHLRLPIATAFALTALLFQTAEAQNTAPYWSLAGNNNATPSSKLGTTNNISLRFYTNNAQRMIIHSPSGHVGIGTPSPLQRLDVNGNINLAKGFGLFMENRRVLQVDSTLSSVFLGNSAGTKNAGLSNTAVGSFALAARNTGAYNTAYGYSALNYNTSGYSNTGIGTFSLSLNTTGNSNTATGHGALYINSTGSSNTATGTSALYNNTTGNQNVATGQGSLVFNTAGSYNTALGSEAMNESTTGSENTAIGYRAMLKNTTGARNVAVGDYALAFNYAAWNNTAVGDYAGARFAPGWNNTYIGSNADATFSGAYNSIAIGNEAKVTASNQVRIGNWSTTSIGGYANWTNISDGRVKRNIKENVPGLAFINKLKPVTYTLDLDAADKLMGVADRKDKDGKTIATQLSPADLAARTAKQKVVYTGFVAQDVEKAARELNYEFSGVDAAKNEKDLYGLRYNEFIMPLVKAVQELSKENEELKNRLEKLEANLGNKKGDATSFQASKISAAALSQNTPNPAQGNTRISYSLPQTGKQAQLLLTDNGGKTIRSLTLTHSGYVDVDITGLSSGVYSYSLVVDGKVVDTKRLTVAR